MRRSSQKKRRVKEYDRKRKTKATKEELQIAATMNGYTRYARIKATYRLKQKMPETPKKYAQVISSMIKRCTPRKRAALKEVGVTTTSDVKLPKAVLDKLKKSGKDRKSRTLRRMYAKMAIKHYSSLNKASKNLGLRWHFLLKISASKEDDLFEEAPRNPPISQETEEEVKTFYKCPELSVTLGGAKNSTKKGETIHYLTEKVNTVYSQYVQKFGVKVSKSKFAKMRPKNVRLKCQIPKNECVCLQCENVERTINVLRDAGVKLARGGEMDKHDVLSATMCDKKSGQKYHNLDCIERKNC